MRDKKPMTTALISSMTETYDKERAARLSAFEERQKSGPVKSRQFEVYKKKLEMAAPKPGPAMQRVKDAPEARFNKKKSRLPLINIDTATPGSDLKKYEVMNPVQPKVKGLLYDGLSKESKGRWLYLRERTMPGPDVKYQYQVCSSWEYGWKMNENIPSPPKPVYGRTCLVRDTFYSRSGIPGLKVESAY